MEVTQRLDELEGELKIIKNEVQSVLLDVREHVLSYNKNPFQMINFRPPTPKEEADEEDGKPGARRERDAAGVGVTPGGEGADPGGGTDMGNQEANNKLKALMDQLERDRQALKDEKQELAQQAAAASNPQSAPGASPPAQGGQNNPGFQPPSQQYPHQPQPGQGFGQQPMYPSSQPGQGFSPPAQQFPSQPSRPSAAGQQPARSSQSSRRVAGDNSPQSAAEQANRFRKRFSGEFSGMEEEERRPEGRRVSGSAARLQGARDEPDEGETNKSQVNLLTLVGLVRWVEKSIKRIGKEKLESIVEIYQTAGYLPTSQKEVIAQILKLADGEKPEGPPATMGVSIQVLLELDSLMGGKFQTESSILSTLFTEDGGYPWTKQ